MSEPRMILFEQIRTLVEQARGRAARAVNQTMTETYWHIGRLIVEEEQGGDPGRLWRETYSRTVSAAYPEVWKRVFRDEFKELQAVFPCFSNSSRTE